MALFIIRPRSGGMAVRERKVLTAIMVRWVNSGMQSLSWRATRPKVSLGVRPSELSET